MLPILPVGAEPAEPVLTAAVDAARAAVDVVAVAVDTTSETVV